ncbi:type II secretion system secretin GspD [Desulfobacterales bacterium HSG2]|nr:type II secretion system secretin GspD [Desulfobacterales bacterium HSG2]
MTGGDEVISFVSGFRIGDKKKRIVFCIFFALLLCAGCVGQKTLVRDDAEADKEIYPGENGDTFIDSSPLYDITSWEKETEAYSPESEAPFHTQDIPALAHTEEAEPRMKPPVSKDKKVVRPAARVRKRPKRDRRRSRTDPSQAGQIVLNFDNADLQDVIRNLAELLSINYIVDSNVNGTVTIHTAGKLRKSDLFPVFFQILEANGLTAIKEDSLYKIVSLKEAPRMPIASRFGDSEDIPPGERIIIQIIPLKFISVQEITKLLTPFISAAGTIVSHEDSNTLLLVDKNINILKALRLIETFDVNLFEKVNHRIYRLEYSDAEDMAKTITDIIASYGAEKGDVKCISIERLNILIVISSVPYLFDKIEELIRQIDLPGHDIEPRIYVYSVKNGEAAELAELLNSVFSEVPSAKERRVKKGTANVQADEKKPGRSAFQAAFGSAVPKSVPEKVVRTTGIERSGAQSGSGTLKGEIRITPDEVRNALIIEATLRDYQIIENILKRLDVLPRQVLIEVTIAEIKLDTKTELGVEWSYFKGSGRPDTSTLEAKIGVAGLKYLIGQTARWEAALTALATDKKINILSAPSVLASDNKEAKIDISTEVPVASAIYNKDDSNVIETNIQYRNTGVILSVTPHINEFGLVSMDINQEVSNQLEDPVQVGTGTQPAFFKRSVNTSLTVKHGQTIVIGGMIQQTENRGFSGLPCLGGIPAMQYLFGKKSESIDKTELIILITPRVIATLEDVDAVTEEFRRKVKF